MIDIVEAAAMLSLDKMEAMLARRPQEFPTHSAAIQWAIGSGVVNNPVSASVSIPTLLKQREGAAAVVADGAGGEAGGRQLTPAEIVMQANQRLAAAGGGGGAAAAVPAVPAAAAEAGPWVWRTDIRSTAALWPGWFEGMDAAFLSCGRQADTAAGGSAVAATRRLLLLNSLDSLGRELTVAQMQGQIRVEPLPGRGHHLQEEDPYRVADALLSLA